MDNARKHRRNDAGVGVLGSVFGVCAFLGLLIFATHILLGLYATNVITATAWDTARYVASQSESDSRIVAAQEKATSRLRGYKHLSVDIRPSNEFVHVRITASRPGVLPRALLRSTRLGTIDRTAAARIEREQ